MRLSIFLSAVLYISSLCVATAAGPSGAVATDPAKAGPDFSMQGEYSGEIQTEDGFRKIGAQVIALGGGKFSIIGHTGGLPGDGWSRGDDRTEYEAAAVNGEIVFAVGDASVQIKDGKANIEYEGQTLGTLNKVNRESPTLGKKPPAGALVLFDGSGVEQFDQGKLVEKKWLGATNVSSKEKFGDHHLHLEFRTPFMPEARGQGRGNSGVYMQSRYELQVLDSFGLEGKDNECGGIYSISQPDVNMCFPPLSWQTYDIDFTSAKYDDDGKKTSNARVTVRHNGVVIHDDRELAHGTPGRNGEGPGNDALFLQDHGNPVVFRNIWVLKK
ncbi:DUF1080 domain-containing protein [bacterium]|nr:DUF1080 domain-containing protein [bacterium]MDB4809705.1 DUF1080 domain-containing protein [bacterium]